LKRYLLPLLLAVAFLFSGLNNANAAAFKATITSLTTVAGTTSGYNLQATPVVGTASNYAVGVFSIVGTGGTTGVSTTTINSIEFEQDGTSTAGDNTYYTTAYLYSSSSSVYTPGTTNTATNLVSQVNSDGTYFFTFPTTNITVTSGSTMYYFVVLSNNLGNTTGTPNGSNFNVKYYANTYTGTTLSAAANVTGPNYTFLAATPCTATVSALGAAGGGANGLYGTNPITATSTKIPLYGVQITPTTTAASERSITQLNFTAVTSPAQNNNYFFGNVYLYSSPTNTFNIGTATLVSTIAAAGSTTLNFTGLNILLDYNTPVYYFIACDYNTLVAATTTWQLNYTSCTSNTTVTGTANGYNWTFNAPPPVTGTATSLTTMAGNNGTSTPATISSPGTYTIYGMQIVGATGSYASKAITTLNFSTSSTNGNSYFYGTAYLFAGTATGPSGAAIGTINPTTTSQALSFTGLTGQTLTAGGTLYYYVEIVYSVPGVAATNSTTLSFVSDATGPTLTNGAVAGPVYTYNPCPYVTGTATSLTTIAGNNGTSSPATISAANTYTIYGMQIAASSTGVSENITTLNFSTSNTNGNSYFYGTAYLFAGTATGPSGAAIATINPTTASQALSFTGFTTTQTLTAGGTLYYYVEIVYSTPGVAASNSTTLSFVSDATGPTLTNGAVAGPAYLYNPVPIVIATNVPTADLTASAIYVGQTDIGLSGIGLSTNVGTTTLTQLTFGITPNTTTAAQLAAYFAAGTVRLISSSTAPSSPFTTAGTSVIVTGVPPISITTGAITVTMPSTVITTSPTYFYLVVDYTVAGGATPKTFTFIPTGYTTALSGPVTPSYTPTNSFTCTAPIYYWTGATNNNWTTGTNWEENTTSGVVTGYYPGQLTTTDNVVISPVQATPTINLTANETIATLTNSAGTATTLNITTAKTLTTGYLTIGATTGTTASSLTLNGTAGYTGTLTATSTGTASTVNDNSTFTLANGFYNMSSGSGLYIVGEAATPASFVVNGGTATFTVAGLYATGNTGSVIVNSGGTVNIPGGNFGLAATNAYLTNAGTFTLTDGTTGYCYTEYATNTITNSGILTITGTTFEAGGAVNVSGGNFTVTNDANTSNFYLGYGVAATSSVTGGAITVSNNANFWVGYNKKGTQTITGGTINLLTSAYYATGTNTSTITNNGGTIIGSGASELSANYGPVINTSGTITLTGSTLEVATGTTTGYQNNGGTLNLNSSSNLLIDYANTTMANSSGTVILGDSSTVSLNSNASYISNTGSVIFTCNPTSVLNFNNTNCTITNASTGPFTLLSDSTGSATVANLATYPGDFMIGTFNVQRYVSGQNNPGYRNYRILSSQTNKISATPGTGTNLVDLTYLGQTVTSPATYNGAYLGGPGFTNYIANPILYLYKESITPGSAYNQQFTSGKNEGVTAATGTGPNYYVTVASTALGGGINSPSVKVPAGNGYLLYFIGNNTRTTLSNTVPPASAYITSSGYINQGTIPLYTWGTTPSGSLTYTTGTNSRIPGVTVVGNPYPSTIDLKQLYTDNNTTLTTTFYQLDIVNQQYDAYNEATGSSGAGSNRYIASGQGFYVNVNPAHTTLSLTFKEDQKTSTATGAIFPSPTEEFVRVPIGTNTNSIARRLSNATMTNSVTNAVVPGLFIPGPTVANKVLKVNDTTAKTTPVVTAPDSSIGLHLKLTANSITYDECGIYFKAGWSDKFDNYDSMDLDGTSGQVFLSSYTTDDVRTSINALAMFNSKGKRIPLYVSFANSGLYTLGMEDIKNINTNQYSVFLIDNMLKDSLDLTLYGTYNFNYVAGTANDSTRFVLAIEHKPVPHYALLSFSGAKSTDGVLLDWKTINEGASVTYVLQKLAANNTYVFLDSLHSDSSGAYSYIDQHPILGNNTYRLQQTDALGDITYSAPVTIGYNSSSPNGGLNIYPNPAKSMITVTLTTSSTVAQVATADIYNTSGTLIAHKVVNSNSFTHDVSSYQLGVYIIELKNNNGVLVGKSKFVKVN
jgi:hypothetical protein